MGKVPGQAEARLTQPEDIAARVWNWAHSDHRPVLLNLRFFARLDDFSTQGTPAEKPAAGKNACPTRQAMDIQLFAEAALCHHILMTCSTRQMQTGRGSGHDPAHALSASASCCKSLRYGGTARPPQTVGCPWLVWWGRHSCLPPAFQPACPGSKNRRGGQRNEDLAVQACDRNEPNSRLLQQCLQAVLTGLLPAPELFQSHAAIPSKPPPTNRRAHAPRLPPPPPTPPPYHHA